MSKPIEDSLVDILAREHAARRARIEAEAAMLLAPNDTQVDVAPPAIDAATIEARPEAPSRADASNPRLLVEELTRKCCERRAALDEEARRG